MVAAVNPFNEAVNDPNPMLPSTNLVFDVVGLDDVLYTTPLSVTLEPPSKVTLPPLLALVAVMLPALVVAIVAKDGVVKLVSVP